MKALNNLKLETTKGELIIPSLDSNPIVRNTYNGVVYSWEGYAIKILKPDPKNHGFRMGEKKAKSFLNAQYDEQFKQKPKGILIPEGIVLNKDGSYVGIARPISNIIPSPLELPLSTVADSIQTLIKDTISLTNLGYRMDGLSFDSYLFTQEGVKMCEIEQFTQKEYKEGNYEENFKKLMTYISKMFYYVYSKYMSGTDIDKTEFKNWLVNNAKRADYLKNLLEIFSNFPELTLGEYTETVKKEYLKK